jgi:hypothetical protein
VRSSALSLNLTIWLSLGAISHAVNTIGRSAKNIPVRSVG